MKYLDGKLTLKPSRLQDPRYFCYDDDPLDFSYATPVARNAYEDVWTDAGRSKIGAAQRHVHGKVFWRHVQIERQRVRKMWADYDWLRQRFNWQRYKDQCVIVRVNGVRS